MKGQVSKMLGFIASSMVTAEGISQAGRLSTRVNKVGSKKAILRVLKKEYHQVPHQKRHEWLQKRTRAAVELVELRTKLSKQSEAKVKSPES